MNGSYNHIKHLADSNEVVISKIQRPGFQCQGLACLQDHEKHEANQLDDKQRHTRFDYYEYDMLKFGTPS